MRRIPALIGAAALLAATLAGCAAAPGAANCTPEYTSGDSSSIVTATGKVDSKPTKIDFPTPLVVTQPQVSQIVAGAGNRIQKGSQVDYEFTAQLGTGDVLGGSNYDPTQAPARVAVGLPGNAVSKALECSKVGERLALVSTVKQIGDAFGAGALASQKPTDTIVVVIDVVASYPGKSEGFNQLPKDGMPTVVTAVDGTPGIQVPATKPPKKTEIATIKAGSGPVVKNKQSVVVEYSIWTWPAITGDAPLAVTSSWTDHAAVTFPIDDSKLPKGIVDAIRGQKVGSQVLVVIPPGSDNFAAGQLDGVDAKSTVIMVIDLLGLQK